MVSGVAATRLNELHFTNWLNQNCEFMSQPINLTFNWCDTVLGMFLHFVLLCFFPLLPISVKRDKWFIQQAKWTDMETDHRPSQNLADAMQAKVLK